ncbi:MAG: hypothetical protein GC161_02545 [Planctomycetaceae bacterium]|nr:hypothetical protein [Planctomycetaceae bacterium]
MARSHTTNNLWMAAGAALVWFAQGRAASLQGASAGDAATAQGAADPFAIARAKLPEGLLVFPPLERDEWSSTRLVYQIRPHYGSASALRVRLERAHEGRPFERYENWESAHYLFTALASRLGGEVAYVAGIREDGSCVVERWVTEPREAGWSVALASPPAQPNGAPSGPAELVYEVAHADQWRPRRVGQSGLGPVARSTVLTTPAGPITAMAADPEGRFLLYYDLGLGTLFQRDLLAPDTLSTAIAPSSTAPALDQVGSLELFDVEGEGRICLVSRSYGQPDGVGEESYLVLHDAENDGLFERSTALTREQWSLSPYADTSKRRVFWRERPAR